MWRLGTFPTVVGMARYARTETIDAPSDRVWQVVGDVTGTENGHLKSQEVISGEGQGMVRRCVDTKDRDWTETCTLWRTGERYRFEVDTAAHPLPMRSMAAEVNCTDQNGATSVELIFDYQFALGPLTRIMNVIAKPVLARIAAQNFKTWRRQVAVLSH